jgi:hypothetical protein
MSDLDGDQGNYNIKYVHLIFFLCILSQHFFLQIASDNEDTVRTEETNQDDYDNEEAPRPITKLPSFKKKQRAVDDEESARLEEVRREIREMKNSSPRRDEVDDEVEEGPIDPRQGEHREKNVLPLYNSSIHISL